MLQTLKLARNRGVPLVAISTPDPDATIQTIAAGLNGSTPLVRWDIVRGFREVNGLGNDALSVLDMPDALTNPAEAMTKALDLPQGTIILAETLMECMNEAGISGVSVAQAVRQLREEFKTQQKMLVMVCVTVTLPDLLKNDVLVIDEALPGTDQLQEIIKSVYEGAEMEPEDSSSMVQSITGLPAFAAEQALAMSLKSSGMNMSELWERKRQMIGQTPGLSVRNDTEKFDDIGGVNNAKSFLQKIIAGKLKPGATVFIDECEKAMAGSQGDTSGVSQDFLGVLLSWMQDTNAAGILAIGPAGSGKSAIAKATGNEAGVPTIAFDIGGMKAQFVGQSEGRIRNALKVVDAVSSGRVLVIATCNNITTLPPELRRRFTYGTFFFDLPDSEERDVIWSIYREKYSIPEEYELPENNGWTGAEIKQCCLLADSLAITLQEASQFIVPVYRAAREQIETLRTLADGRFISASYPGVYTKKKAAGGRKISVEE